MAKSKKQKQSSKSTASPSKPGILFIDKLNDWLSGMKGIIVYFFVALVILSFFQGPFAFEGKKSGGVDVVASIGKSHQMVEWEKSTGERALWNPYIFGGMPHYHFVAPVAYSLDNLIRIFHKVVNGDFLLFIMGGISILLLLNYLGVIPIWSFLLAILFILWPHFHALIVVGHFMKFRALMFLPWVILTFIQLLDKPTLMRGGLFSLALVLQLRTQHYQIVFYTLLLAFILGIIYLIDWIRMKDYKTVIKFSSLFIPAVLFIVLAISQPTLLTREYAKHSTRGGNPISLTQTADKSETKGVGINYATRWSLAPSELLDLVFPRLHGGTSTEIYDGKAVPQWRGQKLPLYWGQMPFTQSYEYLGVLVVLLALIGILFYWNSSKIVRAFAVTLVIAILLGFGRHFVSFYKLFFNYVPYFDKFRVPIMIITLIQFLLLILSGFGLKGLMDISDGERKRKIVYGILGSGVFILIVALIYKSQVSFVTPQESGQYQQQVLKALQDARSELASRAIWSYVFFFAMGAVVIWLGLKEKISWGIAGIGVLVIAGLDLFPMTVRFMKAHGDFKDPQQMKRMVFQKTYLENMLLQDNEKYRVFPFGPFFQNNRWSFYFESIGGYDAAKLQSIQNVIENNLNFPLDRQTPINWNVLDILNVKYIFLPQQFSHEKLDYLGKDATKGVEIYRYKEWKPRIFPVKEVKKMPDERTILATLNTTVFQPDSVALVTEDIAASVSYPDSFAATITEHNPNTFQATIYSDKSTFVVISEMYYPKWKAYLDDQEIPLYRVDHLVRGIVLPAGAHTLTMRFDDSTFNRAVWYSWLGLLVIYAGIIVGFILERRKKENE
ncbi:MAG: YfhO family protein [Calditrichia bacterium]